MHANSYQTKSNARSSQAGVECDLEPMYHDQSQQVTLAVQMIMLESNEGHPFLVVVSPSPCHAPTIVAVS